MPGSRSGWIGPERSLTAPTVAPAPRRTATISARIETAISPGSSAPMSSPIGARTRGQGLLGDAVLQQPLAPPGLGLPRAHGADVRRALLQRGLDRRPVEPLVVTDHDDGIGVPEGVLSLVERGRGPGLPARRGDHRGEGRCDRTLTHHQHVRDVGHVLIMHRPCRGVATRRVEPEMSTSFPIPGLESVAPAEPRTTRRGPTADELLDGPQRAPARGGRARRARRCWSWPARARARPGC